MTANLAGVFNDPDNDPLTLSVSSVSNGSLFLRRLRPSAAARYDAARARSNGTATVTVLAQDASGGSVTADHSLAVTPVNDAPTVDADYDQNPPEDSAPIVIARPVLRRCRPRDQRCAGLFDHFEHQHRDGEHRDRGSKPDADVRAQHEWTGANYRSCARPRGRFCRRCVHGHGQFGQRHSARGRRQRATMDEDDWPLSIDVLANDTRTAMIRRRS